jgi:peptidoglycan/xylan/chitin deacetylase (PgdA/CDA1 family)
MADPSQLSSSLATGAVALGAGAVSAGGLLAYSVFASRCQFWAPVVRSIPQHESVALTFDDGPDERFTPRILDCLVEHQVRATFFVIGRFARKHPGLIRRIHSDGHDLGNHSLDHDHFGVNHGRDYWRNQLATTQQIVAEIVGRPPNLFRPPMGFKTWHIARAARELRLAIIGWSVRGRDTKNLDSARLALRLIRRTAGHDIVVLHDGVEPGRIGGSQEPTVAALPAFLSALVARGLSTLTIHEALVPQASMT